MSSQCGKLRPTNGWDRLASLGHPSKFPLVLRLRFVTALTSFNGEVTQTLHDVLSFRAMLYYIDIFGAPNRILPGATFTLHPSLAFSCIGSVTAWHSSSVHQPNFCSVWQVMEIGNFRSFAPPIFRRAAITLGIGPHSSFSDVTMLKLLTALCHNDTVSSSLI